jgi:membrane protease YdiL (CAAX protease family)
VSYFAWQVVASIASGFILAWVYNRTQGSLLLAMILHAAQNSTASLVGGMLGITSHEQFAMVAGKYSLVYIVTSAVLILIVAIATRGRFGYHAEASQTN